MAQLLLFDIDGTLVLSGGAGARAMILAFEHVFGAETGITGNDGFAGVPMAGRTDTWIVRELSRIHGIETSADRLQQFHDAYVGHLRREIYEPGPRKGVLPGVQPLLDALSRHPETHLALLTGNFTEGARVKLEYFDLWRYFLTGAFGEDAPDRNGLFDHALARVVARGGPRFSPSDVVVIGDTPLDVGVALAAGARSVAVATGSYDRRTLAESGADVVLEDFSDLDAVLAALDSF